MTVFPETPRMEAAGTQDGREMRRLTEDHVTVLNYCLGWSLVLVVKAGYETDGATVSLAVGSDKSVSQIKSRIRKYFPCEDENSIYNRIVGTPWDLPRLLAAVPHDALYSRKWKCRFLCDRVYKRILKSTEYEVIRREIEYDVIRLLGWRSWNAVSKEEKAMAKQLVTAKWVRTKSVPLHLANIRITEKRKG